MPKTKPEPEKQKPARNVRGATKTTRDANSSTVTKQPSTLAEQESVLLELFCILEGQNSSFSVEILSSKTVDDLKQAIYNKIKNAPRFRYISPHKLALYKVSIPDEDKVLNKSKIESEHGMKKLAPSSMEISDKEAFGVEMLPKRTIHVFVEPPEQEHPVRKAQFANDAISMAGLAKKARLDGQKSRLSNLDSKERIEVLSYLERDVVTDGPYCSIPNTARKLRESGTAIKDLDILSTFDGSVFPVVGTKELYVREEYRDLYDHIISNLTLPAGSLRQNRLIVSGTPGIGKSAFLVFFAIRLLVESDENKPPIVVFQEKESSTCYVYGGLDLIISRDISGFKFLLNLPETWYLVDSSRNPALSVARSIYSISPETLEAKMYDNVAKETSKYYYMSPWRTKELTSCREKVEYFNVVTQPFMEELFLKMGGVPRFILQVLANVLDPYKNATEEVIQSAMVKARRKAYSRVDSAIKTVQDPANLLQCFAQGMESKEFSDHILHRWPTDDHEEYRLEWASSHVM
ncbi:hypothetical protein BGX27_002839 [Mortierella sp. AM989]|nr:hypothetical protein BGX27_002839 [Mortierella sp. AM989]